MSVSESTRQAVARQRAAARGRTGSSNPFSDEEDSSMSTSGTSSQFCNPFDDEVTSQDRRRSSRDERALRPTQDKAGSNPFEEPEVVKQSSATVSYANPFDDEDATAVRTGKGRGRGNPFDDDKLVLPKLVVGSAESGNVFDDPGPAAAAVERRHKSLSSLEKDSLFAADEKVGRRKSGGSEGAAAAEPRRSGRATEVKEKLCSAYSGTVEKVAAVSEGVSTRLQKPRKPRQNFAEERETLYSGGSQSRPPIRHAPLRLSDEGLQGQSVEQLKAYAYDVSKETSSTLQNSLRVAESTREIAGQTLLQIQEQGVQIRKTHETAVRVDEHLSTGEKLLGSLGGMFSRTWKPKKGHAISGPVDEPIQDYRRKEYAQQRAALEQGGGVRAGRVSTSQFQAKEPWEQERIKQDEDLDKLSEVLTSLKGMSEHMGAEINRQNQGLETLQNDIVELNSRVKQSNERGRKLLR